MSQSAAAAGSPLPWELVGAFLAVVRTGSLSGAARALGVTQPTIRRQIEALEAVLGASLFTRSFAGLAPTDTATAAVPFAEAMASAADALVRSVSGAAGGEEGTVRITCSEVIGLEVLPTILAELRRAHPRLQIELSATNARADLLRRDADIAIRMAAPTQGALTAKKIGAIEVGLFATVGYLAEHPAPATAEQLVGHALIGRDRDPAFLAALAEAGVRLRAADFALRTDSDVAQLAAVRAGLGIGICQVALAARGGLRRVLPALAFRIPTWVVAHEDLRASKRVSVVFAHLVAALTAYARTP